MKKQQLSQQAQEVYNYIINYFENNYVAPDEEKIKDHFSNLSSESVKSCLEEINEMTRKEPPVIENIAI